MPDEGIEIRIEREGKPPIAARLKPYGSRLELLGLASLIGELQQIQAWYEALRGKLAPKMNGESDGKPIQAVEAFDAIVDLEGRFRTRCLPLWVGLSGELAKRQIAGTPIPDFGIGDLAEAANQFLRAQGLSEGERKN